MKYDQGSEANRAGSGLAYHTEHFFSGFIAEPRGQPKDCANSGAFERGPMILKRAGE